MEVVGGGKLKKVKLKDLKKELKTGESLQEEIALEEVVDSLKDFEFLTSGQLVLTATTKGEDGKRQRVSAPPLYFHPEPSGKIVIYDKKRRDQEFGKGDYRGQHLADSQNLGFIEVGSGLPPEILAKIQKEDPIDVQ